MPGNPDDDDDLHTRYPMCNSSKNAETAALDLKKKSHLLLPLTFEPSWALSLLHKHLLKIPFLFFALVWLAAASARTTAG